MKKYFKKILALILVVMLSNTFMINSYVYAETVDYVHNINCGTGTISDYEGAAITGVDSTNLTSVNNAVKASRENQNDDLTKEEIQQIITNLPSMVSNSLDLINQGAAAIYDYSLLGITGVTPDNIVDVNDYLKGKNLTTTAKIQGNATVVIKLIKNINDGCATISTYKTLGITSVNVDNFTPISLAIKNQKVANGRNLTKSEIVAIVSNIADNFSNYINAINNGQAGVSDYTSLGITDVTAGNLSDVNDYVKGKDNSTVTKIQANVAVIVNALNNINNGSKSVTDYTTLGITKVNTENVTAVGIAVRNAKVIEGSNLTKSQILAVIDDTMINLVNIKARINNGQGTSEDYASIGLTGVTKINLGDVNTYVKGKDNSTFAKLQTNVNAIVRPLNSMNSGSAIISDYTILGITTVNAENVAIINTAVKAEKVKVGSDLTKADIIKVVYDTIGNMNQSKTTITNGQGTLVDYTLLGIKGVTDLNLTDINQYIKGRDNTTLAKLQANVTVIANAINSISVGTAAITNYTLLGITTVNAENLNAVNIATKNASTLKACNLTKVEIVKTVADTIVSLNKAKTLINTGVATVDDYTLLGVKGVTENNILDVNDYVKGRDNTTTAKLQVNVTTITNAINCINNGNATVVNYTTLGITTVTTDNITPMNLTIKNEIISKGTNLTRADITKLVADTIVIINDSKTNINSGNGTLDDYTLLAIKGITEINLTDVNAYVTGKDNTTLAKLQANVTAFVNALNSINNNTGSIANYATLGITSVNTEILPPVNLAIKNAKIFKGDSLLKVEIIKVISDTIVSLNAAKTNINSGNGTIDEYTLVGIRGVTDINLTDVNTYVTGKDNTTLAKLQANVTAVVNALSYINNGSTVQTYYTTLNITGVNAENIVPISIAIRNMQAIKGSNLTLSEIITLVDDTIVSLNGARGKIDKGQGTLDDFNLVGIKGVTDINLDDINDYIKTTDNTTVAKLQANVALVVNALNYINNGSLVVGYYSALSIFTVNSSNIKAVSLAVKDAKTIKGFNLTKAEIIGIVNGVVGA